MKGEFKLRSHGRHAAAEKFRRRDLRRPHRFQGNVLCSILSNGNLVNHVVVVAAAAAVFDSGSPANFA